MNRLRLAEYVPPMVESDARLLRALPSRWEEPIAESAVDGLRRRAMVLASRLERAHRAREAAELHRRIALLERAADLHRHASDVETIAGLYRALATFAREPELPGEYDRTWVQAGVLEGAMCVAHGPAYRETAALRNRAYRWLAAALAEHARGAVVPPR